MSDSEEHLVELPHGPDPEGDVKEDIERAKHAIATRSKEVQRLLTSAIGHRMKLDDKIDRLMEELHDLREKESKV